MESSLLPARNGHSKEVYSTNTCLCLHLMWRLVAETWSCIVYGNATAVHNQHAEIIYH